MINVGSAQGGETVPTHDNIPKEDHVVKEFVLLNEMRFRNQPDLTELGFEEIRVVYASEFWPSKKAENHVDTAHILNYIDYKLEHSKYICLDIEHWPMDIRRFSETDVDSTISKFRRTLALFELKRPDAELGIYSMLPIRDYHTPVKEKGLVEWKLANQYLRQISINTDIIYPSLYTFYKKPEQWKKYAVANIEEAKIYGKKVIPFIWPQYHGSNKLRSLNTIDYDYWKMQLETVYKHADGVVIWSPAGKARSDWNDNADWWRATIDFINEKNLQK